MKYLLEYNTETYKGLYVTPIILEKLYCRFLDWYEDSVIKTIDDLCEFINHKYKDVLVVEMKRNIQPGLIANNHCDIKKIAEDINNFLNERGMDNRVVYGEGTVSHFEDDIHRCDGGRGEKGSLLVGIGRMTDKLKNQTGLFEFLNESILKKISSPFIKLYKDHKKRISDLINENILLYKSSVYKYIDENISGEYIDRISFGVIYDDGSRKNTFRYYFWIGDIRVQGKGNYIECILYLDKWGMTNKISIIDSIDDSLGLDIENLKMVIKNIVLDALDEFDLNECEEEEEEEEEEVEENDED